MKILLVATVQSHICQFHKPLVKMLHDHGCEVHVAARDNLAEKNGLKLDFADRVFDIPFARSPFNKSNISAYRQLKELIEQERYDAVHCNTPVGGILARLAAKQARKQGCKVIYTAHGFHFFRGGPKKSWMIYYPIEKHMCRYTDLLITINEEDYALAQKHFPVQTARIHGVGASSKKYCPAAVEEQTAWRKQHGYENDRLLICTGELNENKNQLTAIRAMPAVVNSIPNAKLMLAGNGPMDRQLQDEINRLGMSGRVELLGYRTNLQEFVRSSEVVVSCSKREGMPLNIIESMLCEKPVVASINRGHKELVKDGLTGYLLNAGDVTGFGEKIITLLSDPGLAVQMGKAGRESAVKYTDTAVYGELEEIYDNLSLI